MYQLLFRTPLAIQQGEDSVRPQESIRKYWQVALWDALFDCLLNKRSSLGKVRKGFEDYLVGNHVNTKRLNGFLSKQDMNLAEAEM